MILNDQEIKERIESPLNLLNRLKTSLNKITTNTPISPCLPPKSSDIIDNLEDKINNASAKSKALSIMVEAMDELKLRLGEVQKPERLASIASEMSKIISHQDAKDGDKSLSQIIIYAPQVQNIDSYDVIDVVE